MHKLGYFNLSQSQRDFKVNCPVWFSIASFKNLAGFEYCLFEFLSNERKIKQFS